MKLVTPPAAEDQVKIILEDRESHYGNFHFNALVQFRVKERMCRGSDKPLKGVEKHTLELITNMLALKAARSYFAKDARDSILDFIGYYNLAVNYFKNVDNEIVFSFKKEDDLFHSSLYGIKNFDSEVKNSLVNKFLIEGIIKPSSMDNALLLYIVETQFPSTINTRILTRLLRGPAYA